MAEKTSISIMYEEQESRPTVPVSGAFGGPGPDGELVFAHVYSEFATVPALEEHDVGPGGIIDFAKGNVIKRGDVTRKVLATLVLSPEAAIRLGEWLAGTGRLALQARGKQPK